MASTITNSTLSNVMTFFTPVVENLTAMKGRAVDPVRDLRQVEHLAKRALDCIETSSKNLESAFGCFTNNFKSDELPLVKDAFKKVFGHVTQPASKLSSNKAMIGFAAVATLIGVVAYKTLFMGDAQKSEKTLGERISIAMQPATALSENLLSKIW